MTVFYTNIDTLRTKIDELKIRSSTEKPHLGCDRLVTSRRGILLPRRRNFAGESIKNFRLLSTKLYIVR